MNTITVTVTLDNSTTFTVCQDMHGNMVLSMDVADTKELQKIVDELETTIMDINE